MCIQSETKLKCIIISVYIGIVPIQYILEQYLSSENTCYVRISMVVLVFLLKLQIRHTGYYIGRTASILKVSMTWLTGNIITNANIIGPSYRMVQQKDYFHYQMAQNLRDSCVSGHLHVKMEKSQSKVLLLKSSDASLFPCKTAVTKVVSQIQYTLRIDQWAP